MESISLLYKDHIPINDKINVIIPTVGQIESNEDAYYNLVSIITAMPIDFMVQLDDAGIDFTQIDEYELFIILFGGLAQQDTSLIFGDLDLSKFHIDKNETNGMLIFRDDENDITIDRAIHDNIASTLRTIHHFEKDVRKPANKAAKKFMLQRARTKLKRNQNKKQKSNLESLIVAMVNKECFKYNYEDVRNISIYQFNESVRQIISVVDYEHKMQGVYAGTIDPKHMSQDEFNWLMHK